MTKKRVIKKRVVKRACVCPFIAEEVSDYGGFQSAIYSNIGNEKNFWFRGQADISWSLEPSALRYSTNDKKKTALEILADFKRFSEAKLDHLIVPRNTIGWLQIAQHYGLPTRLLDWTNNLSIALYFSCCDT